MKKVLMLMAVLAITGIASAELLTDPGFEAGAWPAGYGAAYTSYWVGYGFQTVVTDASVARSGNNYLSAGNYAYGASWGYSLVWEDVAATVGTNYNLSAYFMDDWGASGATGTIGAVSKLEFIDSGGAKTTIDGSAPIAKDWDLGWQQLSVSGVAPAGTVTVRAVVGQGSNANSYVRVDDASLVPEPATMALLGLGGLFLRRRRK